MSALAPLWYALSGSVSRYLPLVVFIALIGVVSCATSALAQTPTCNQTETVEQLLQGKYREHVYDQYLADGRLYQLWLNFETGTGSLVVRHPSGMSCIVKLLQGMLPARRVNT